MLPLFLALVAVAWSEPTSYLFSWCPTSKTSNWNSMNWKFVANRDTSSASLASGTAQARIAEAKA